MEIRVLKYFLAVAREENITRASEILHITQPTLSRQLMQLEEELGTQLFIRGKNKIILTEDGMLLRRRAEEIVDLTDKTEKEFYQKDETLSGEISIGGGETTAMRFVADVIKGFQEKYPLVQYNLYSGNADDVKEKIDNGLLDIGLLTEPVDIGKYDFVRLPQKDIWGVLMRKDHYLASKEYIIPSDLKNQKIMCSKRILVQNELANWFSDIFEEIEIIATYNLIYNASLLVESGIGLAVCFENLVHINDDIEICFKPFQPSIDTGSVLVWKKHQVFSSATTQFIESIKQHAKVFL